MPKNKNKKRSDWVTLEQLGEFKNELEDKMLKMVDSVEKIVAKTLQSGEEEKVTEEAPRRSKRLTNKNQSQGSTVNKDAPAKDPVGNAPENPKQVPVDTTQAPVDPTEIPVDSVQAPVDPAPVTLDPVQDPVETAQGRVDPVQSNPIHVDSVQSNPIHVDPAQNLGNHSKQYRNSRSSTDGGREGSRQTYLNQFSQLLQGQQSVPPPRKNLPIGTAHNSFSQMAVGQSMSNGSNPTGFGSVPPPWIQVDPSFGTARSQYQPFSSNSAHFSHSSNQPSQSTNSAVCSNNMDRTFHSVGASNFPRNVQNFQSFQPSAPSQNATSLDGFSQNPSNGCSPGGNAQNYYVSSQPPQGLFPENNQRSSYSYDGFQSMPIGRNDFYGYQMNGGSGGSQNRGRYGSMRPQNGSNTSISRSSSRINVVPPRQGTYDGKRSWEAFITGFERKAISKSWNDNEKLDMLHACLVGDAEEFAFCNLGADTIDDYYLLRDALAKRFREYKTENNYIRMLEGCTYKKNDDVSVYTSDIKKLVRKAFTSADQETVRKLEVRHFTNGIRDEEWKYQVNLKVPKTIEEAEEWLRLIIDHAPEKKSVRMVKQTNSDDDNEEYGEEDGSDDEDLDIRVVNYGRKRFGGKNFKSNRQNKDMKSVQSTLEKIQDAMLKSNKSIQDTMVKSQNEFGETLKNLCEELKKDGKYRKPLEEVQCFKCTKYGHFASSCPLKDESSDDITTEKQN